MSIRTWLSGESSIRNKAFIAFVAIAIVAAFLVLGNLGTGSSSSSIEETTEMQNTGATAPDPKSNAQTAQTVGVDEAYVGLTLEHAYINYLDQDISLPTDSVKVSLKDGLKFQAIADSGYQISDVSYTCKDETQTLSPDKEGFYSIDNSLVTSALTIYVTATESGASGTGAPTGKVVLKYDTEL